MSSFSYLLKNSTIRLMVFSVGIISAFTVTPHILRSMGTDVYGVWALIASLIPYFALFNLASSNSISSIYAKAVSQQDNDLVNKILVAAIQFALLAFFCALCIACCYYYLNDNQYIKKYSFFISLFTFTLGFGTFQILNISHGFLAGQMKWTTLALTAMLRVLTSSIASLCFISADYTPEQNIIHMACIHAISFLLESFLNLFFARSYLHVPSFSSFLYNPFKSIIFSIGKSLFLNQLGSILRNSTQIYLINAFLSASVVAFYSLSNQLIRYMNDLLLSVFGILNPYFSKLQSENESTKSKQTLLVSIFLSYGISSIISLGLICYGNLFFIRWVGQDFATISILLTPMALAALAEQGSLPVCSYLIGVQKQHLLAKLTLYEGVCIVFSSIFFLYFFGLAGVGWAMCIFCFIFRFAWLPKKICEIANIPLILYYKNLFFAIFPTCLVQLIFYYFIKDYVSPDYFSIVLVGIGQGMLAVACMYVILKNLAYLRER